MARKQMTIEGMGRKQHPQLEEAAEKYRDARNTRMEHTKVETRAKLELLATMQMLKIKVYKYDDPEGEEEVVTLEEKQDVKVRKSGEVQSDVGEAVDESGPKNDPGVHPGLIAQAMKAQADAGVSEVDGDVVTPDSAAPSKKRARKAKSK